MLFILLSKSVDYYYLHTCRIRSLVGSILIPKKGLLGSMSYSMPIYFGKGKNNTDKYLTYNI